jgi:hypothetical protein
MRRAACALPLVLALHAPDAFAQAPPCPDAVPAAMKLTGVPSAAVAGRTYTVGLREVGDGALELAGTTLTVLDRRGRGWSARYQYVRGLSQQLTFGLLGPYTVTAAYTEQHAERCLRTLRASVPVIRRFYAVVGCTRRAARPTSLLLRCGGDRMRIRGLRWRSWNRDTAVGRGSLRGAPARVTLSRPVQCDELDAYIYTRARVVTPTRTYPRIPIACPLPQN